MRGNPSVEGVFPLLLAIAQAHGYFVVELDLGIGSERYGAPLRLFGTLFDQHSRDRTPQDGRIDFAGGKITLDGPCGRLVDVAILMTIADRVVHQSVFQQPIRTGRLREDANAQSIESVAR